MAIEKITKTIVRTTIITRRIPKLIERPTNDVSPYIGINKFLIQTSSARDLYILRTESKKICAVARKPRPYHQKGSPRMRVKNN